MIGLGVLAVLVTLAAPSLYDFILTQRLKSIQAQLVTDLQNARSETEAANADVYVHFRVPPEGESGLSCYTIYVEASPNPRGKCDCRQAPDARCPQSTTREIRTEQVAADTRVRLALRSNAPSDAIVGFDRVTRGTLVLLPDFVRPVGGEFVVVARVDDARSVRTTLQRSGRPSACDSGSRSIVGTAC